MSKMSMIHAELMEQCARLGFQDLGEAEQAGYGVDWQNARLIKVEDEQDKAHEAWLKERFKVLADLKYLMKETDDDDTKDALKRAINFIEEQCHD